MSQLLPKTFLWMFIGLILTFLTGYIVSININMLEAVFSGYLFIILAIIEIALVIFFSARLPKMQPITAKICFLLYSFINGLTFSSIFVQFNLTSIMYIFLVSALVFAIFGVIGYITKIDLSRFSTFLIMALLATIIMMLINIFIQNSTFDLVITIISLIIFFIFTAFDIQRIKALSFNGYNDDKIAVYGAFQLYLDFINIFIHLLDLIGDNRN